MSVDALSDLLRERQNRFFGFLKEYLFPQSGRPSWATANRILVERDGYRLRDFSTGGGEGRPVLIVPPEVNQSVICDLAPENSLPGAFLKQGFGRVLVMEWRDISAKTRQRDVDDSIADIIEAAGLVGGPVHLVGLCQGGWEAATVTALRPEISATLTLVAAPIDFSAGLGQIKYLARYLPQAYFQWLTLLGGGVMRGEFISAGFDLLQPVERGWLRPLQVWNNLHDEKWLERYRRLQGWYRTPKDLPAPAYLRIVRELFKENRLAEGRFQVLGERVCLAKIRCPLALVAGGRDHITPPAQLFAAERLVSSRAILKVLTDGGHVGTFMGSQELRKHWPGIMDWLRQQEPRGGQS